MLMTRLGSLCLVAVALLACTGGATPSPSEQPSSQPSSLPSAPASLDPGQSDAGVVGRATVSGDGRADRDGTYDIAGSSADGSVCEQSFSGDEFLANATDESAVNGQLRAMFVSVPVDALPGGDGESSSDITTGRAGFDFKSDEFAGTLYVGEPQDDERTTVSIDVTQTGTDIVFDFSATTWDGVMLTGQLVCADAL